MTELFFTLHGNKVAYTIIIFFIIGLLGSIIYDLSRANKIALIYHNGKYTWSDQAGTINTLKGRLCPDHERQIKTMVFYKDGEKDSVNYMGYTNLINYPKDTISTVEFRGKEKLYVDSLLTRIGELDKTEKQKQEELDSYILLQERVNYVSRTDNIKSMIIKEKQFQIDSLNAILELNHLRSSSLFPYMR